MRLEWSMMDSRRRICDSVKMLKNTSSIISFTARLFVRHVELNPFAIFFQCLKMSFCSWTKGEKYRDHFETGEYA